MPEGTCDPASRGEPYNVMETAEGGGDILISVRYGWDGVSTRETGCDGPLIQLRVRNVSNVVWYALLPRKRRGTKWYQIDPGVDQTITNANQLRNAGLETRADLDEVRLSTTTS